MGTRGQQGDATVGGSLGGTQGAQATQRPSPWNPSGTSSLPSTGVPQGLHSASLRLSWGSDPATRPVLHPRTRPTSLHPKAIPPSRPVPSPISPLAARVPSAFPASCRSSTACQGPLPLGREAWCWASPSSGSQFTSLHNQGGRPKVGSPWGLPQPPALVPAPASLRSSPGRPCPAACRALQAAAWTARQEAGRPGQ